ncbi:hypothetical protein ACH498_25145 [Rhodococcus erythropolis]
MLIDRDGRPARVPSLETIRVPVQWLHRADDPRLHRDADLWPFM